MSLKLAAHCCVDTLDGADFLLSEFDRKLKMHMKRCGLKEGMGLMCCGCSILKACLTMAYCGQCDKNFCAPLRPDDPSGYFGCKCFADHGCINAVPKFPQMRCADLDWRELGNDGKMRNTGVIVARKVLEKKLKLEHKWKKEFRNLRKPELLKKVLEIVRQPQS